MRTGAEDGSWRVPKGPGCLQVCARFTAALETRGSSQSNVKFTCNHFLEGPGSQGCSLSPDRALATAWARPSSLPPCFVGHLGLPSRLGAWFTKSGTRRGPQMAGKAERESEGRTRFSRGEKRPACAQSYRGLGRPSTKDGKRSFPR